MSEVWHARNGIVVRGRALVESGPGGQLLAAAGGATGPALTAGRIYPLACLIAIALCAYTAAGNDRLTVVGQWIRRASQADLARLYARGT